MAVVNSESEQVVYCTVVAWHPAFGCSRPVRLQHPLLHAVLRPPTLFRGPDSKKHNPLDNVAALPHGLQMATCQCSSNQAVLEGSPAAKHMAAPERVLHSCL